MSAQTKTVQSTVVNGINVDDVLALIEGVRRDPAKGSYALDTLTEGAGMGGKFVALADWPGASCNADYCALTLNRGGRDWHLLIAHGTVPVPERALAAACDLSDVVIAARWLPRSCKPQWLKVDRNMLDKTGGLTIDLERGKIVTVAEGEGQHGWWHPVERLPFRDRMRAPGTVGMKPDPAQVAAESPVLDERPNVPSSPP